MLSGCTALYNTALQLVYNELVVHCNYALVGRACRRHMVVCLCFCLSVCVCVCVCVTLQLAFLEARDKLSADTCNAGTTRQYLKSNSLGFLI